MDQVSQCWAPDEPSSHCRARRPSWSQTYAQKGCACKLILLPAHQPRALGGCQITPAPRLLNGPDAPPGLFLHCLVLLPSRLLLQAVLHFPDEETPGPVAVSCGAPVLEEVILKEELKRGLTGRRFAPLITNSGVQCRAVHRCLPGVSLIRIGARR